MARNAGERRADAQWHANERPDPRVPNLGPTAEAWQPRLPMGLGHSRQFDPVAGIASGAQRYARSKGLEYNPNGLDQVQVDPVRGHAQYLSFRDAPQQRDPSAPLSPHMQRSYEALRKETVEQYDFLTKPEHEGGLGIGVSVVHEDPYTASTTGSVAGSQQMARDVSEKRHISILSTQATGGSHSFFTDAENEKFRAVHDVFGHLGTGRGFSRNGEEAAFQSHRQMFTPAAHAALAAETRGQNSYLNYRTTGAEFPENVATDVPGWMADTTQFKGAPEALAAQRASKKQREAGAQQQRFDI
jgi:hypothetical protein